MASELGRRIESIEAKAKLLLERYDQLRAASEADRERIRDLESDVAERDKHISRLEQELEYLKVASVLSPDHNEVEQTRARLTELVREIDRCIDKLSL